MPDDSIRIPVSARMVKQEDGSFKMVEAEYITTTADAVARFLVERLHVPMGEVKPCKI